MNTSTDATLQESRSAPSSGLPQGIQHVGTTIEDPTRAAIPSASAAIRWSDCIEPHLAWIAGLWLIGVLLLSLTPLGGVFVLWRLRHCGRSDVPTMVAQVAERLAKRMHLSKVLHVAQSSLVEVPTVIGYLRPLVLLPASAISGLSPKELELILAHEFAHIRRHDFVVNVAQTIIETLLFYHPLVWWVSHRVRIERENCCDDVAVAVCGNRAAYVRALLTLEQKRPAAAVAVAASGGSLLARIRRLTGTASPRSGARRANAWLAGVVLLVAIGVPIGVASFQQVLSGAEPSEAVATTGAVPGGTEGDPRVGKAHAWQSEDPYVPPDFEGFFPDNPDAGKRLDALWDDRRKDRRDDAEILTIVRNGLRRTTKHRTSILRWIGNKYIWNQKDQHPDAIEITYHATDGERFGTRHYAVYFGLSVVHKKTPAILRTLADLCMRVDDPNDLGRVAWGCSSQRAELLQYLKPYEESEDAAVREKADVVRRIIQGKLKAFDWAGSRAEARAREKYVGQLPKIREELKSGDSAARRELLRQIQGEAITLIMDDSFLDAFASCAQDEDAGVREQVATLVGGHWVWSAKQQSPKAIDLMLQLSRDPVREVRYDAVYFGLSTVRNKSEEVVARLLEMAYEDREWNLFGRITWGLGPDRAIAKRLLERDMDRLDEDPRTAVAAFQIYADITGSPAPRPERFKGLEEKHAGDYLMLIVFTTKDETANQSPKAFTEAFKKVLPEDAAGEILDSLLISDDQPALIGYLAVDTVEARNALKALLERSRLFQLADITWMTPATAQQMRERFRRA